MNIVWQPQALDDLDETLGYISQDNPQAAYALVEKIFSSVEQILPAQPNIGRRGRVEGTREWVALENYIVVYRVMGNSVDILAVRHAARLWPDVF